METYKIQEMTSIYSSAYDKLIELELVYFDLWFILDSLTAKSIYMNMQRMYPSRKLIPFAKREDNDDVACFEIGKKGKVQLIHYYASEGWEQKREYNDVWGWLEDVVQDMIKWNREGGVV